MPTTTDQVLDPLHERAQDLNTEVMHLTRTMQVVKTHVSAQSGVPWSTYVLLFHLIAGGPQRAGALAEAACTDPSTVSRQVDVLVRLGLAERQADPADGRATLLVATPAGVAQQQRMRAARDHMMSSVLADWDDADLASLTALLARLNARLTDQLPAIVADVQRRAATATWPPVADPTRTQTPKDQA